MLITSPARSPPTITRPRLIRPIRHLFLVWINWRTLAERLSSATRYHGDRVSSCRVQTALQNLDEGLAPQLLEREAALLDRLGFGDRPAIHRAQEVVQQPLSGRRIVEHIADQRRLRRLLHEV